MVETIIETKPEMIDVKNLNKETPLLYAFHANSNLFQKTTNFCCLFFSLYLIHFCLFAEKGSESLLQYLIGKGADVNAKGDYQITSLHWAADYGNFLFMNLKFSC